MNKKKLFLSLIVIFFSLFFLIKSFFAFLFIPKRTLDFQASSKNIELTIDGLTFETSTSTTSVAELLAEKRISLGEHDALTPEKETRLFPRMHIEITKATKIKISADGKIIESYVLGKTVHEALRENQITLSRLDKTVPGIDSLIQNNLLISVTRINVEEIIQKEAVNFKTTVKNDAKLGWQEKKIETPGQLGEKEVKYRITYKNSKEISRVLLSSQITQDPLPQIEVHGTYMKLGKSTSGQGTWYSYQGGMFAASTTIPKGAYAKVTNTQNGKSVVVQINDYGPTGKGRVIDLDKIAFQKIASIGAGVIGVKVEPILN